MLQLSDDLLVSILNKYTVYYIKCKKLKIRMSKLYICRKFKNLYTKYIIPNLKCNLYYIKEIDYNICSFHNNVDLIDIKKIINQIIRIDNNNIPKIYHNNNSYDSVETVSMSDNLLFIHHNNLKNNEKIVRLLLHKFGYVMLNFCCNGTGCRIKKRQKKNQEPNSDTQYNLILDTFINNSFS